MIVKNCLRVVVLMLSSLSRRADGGAAPRHLTATTASISIGMLNGSPATPTAERAWRPGWPNTCSKRSRPCWIKIHRDRAENQAKARRNKDVIKLEVIAC